jgi:hypothetical protein
MEKSCVGKEAEPMRNLLKACKFCHIKNCPFFNQDFYEIFRRMFPTKRLFPTKEEVEETLRKAYNEEEL